VAPSIRKKLAITSPTSGGRSVGIVRSRTQATKFSLDDISTIQLRALESLMIDELGRILKEAEAVKSRNCHGICIEGLSKTMKTISQDSLYPVEIRMEILIVCYENQGRNFMDSSRYLASYYFEIV
jgi:hypothetical protein